MKKVYRAIGIAFALIVVIGVALTVRYFTYDPDRDNLPVAKPVVTDAAGNTYLAVIDGDGTTYAVVTDSEGNRYAAEYNGSQVGNTVGQINDQISLGDIPGYQSGDSFEVSATGNFQGDVSQQTTAPTTTPTTAPTVPADTPESTTKPKETTTQSKELTPYRIEKYSQIFKSGCYIMEFTTSDPDLAGNIVMATKNGNVYMETAMELEEGGTELPMKMIFRNDGQMYLLFDSFKKYSKLPQDMIGEDMDMTDMMSEFASTSVGKITVSKVSINMQDLILESYINPDDGSTVNYYFDSNDVLVRRDIVYSSGSQESIYFTRISNDVADSMFEIPRGYSYLNLSFLSALL